MRKQIFIILLIFFLMVSCGCFTTTAQVKIIKNGIELNTGKINLKAQFYSANIVRIIKWSPGGTSEKLSLSVIKNLLPELEIDIVESKDKIILKSSKLNLEITKSTGNVDFLSKDKYFT